MTYYSKNDVVYSSETKLEDDSFTEITEQEYYERISKAQEGREIGNPDGDNAGDYWGIPDENEATSQDYINALEELGVNFDG